MSTRIFSTIFIIMLLLCTGCTSLKQYRTNYLPCEYNTTDSSNCKDATIEDHKNEKYSLGFVEFDDQGSLWDREQLNKVISKIDKEGQSANGLLLVVFIHGWKNNADFENDNVSNFRESLKQLALLETEAAQNATPPMSARNVMGLYVGWRGLSINDYVINQLTFWDRKNTAERVGHGAVTEFLIQLENASKKAKKNNENTDLVIVGHSFGGLILYSALSQIMMERIASQGNSNQGFGDLVVMLNPAIEAARFTPLQQLAASQKYEEGNFPVLCILTSKGDWATKKTFKIGRWFSTLFESYRDNVQEEENLSAVGHFQPYITHELISLENSTNNGMSVWNDRFSWEETTAQEGYVLNFNNVQLIHKDDSQHKSDPKNPIMDISVDEDVIGDHNDIFNDKLRSFIANLIVSKPQK